MPCRDYKGVIQGRLANRAEVKNWPSESRVRGCTAVEETSLQCGHLRQSPPFLWYIDVDVNSPTETMTGWPMWPYREEIEGISSPTGNASDCRGLRLIPTARPRGDYAQGYICLPCTSETARTPCRISNQG